MSNKLLGDMTEDALKRIGGDKVANFYLRMSGRPCNCAGRKDILNTLHRAAQRAVERKKPRPALPVVKQTPHPVHKQPTHTVDEAPRRRK